MQKSQQSPIKKLVIFIFLTFSFQSVKAQLDIYLDSASYSFDSITEQVISIYCLSTFDHDTMQLVGSHKKLEYVLTTDSRTGLAKVIRIVRRNGMKMAVILNETYLGEFEINPHY